MTSVFVTTSLVMSGGPLRAQTEARYTQADSDSFVRKIAAIERNGATAVSSAQPAPRPGAAPRLTAITERELNAYFRYDMRDYLPAGVSDATVTIAGDGHVMAYAVVDLDQVRDGQSSSGEPTVTRRDSRCRPGSPRSGVCRDSTRFPMVAVTSSSCG